MRDHNCPACGQRLTFENSRCLACASTLGFDPRRGAFVVVPDDRPGGTTGPAPCANRMVAACNWLAVPDAPGGLCRSCELTRTRPADGDGDALVAFADAEAAKRRVVFELLELGLPLRGPGADATGGLTFDLLSSTWSTVVTGYADGVVTLDLAESDDVHREQLRVSMAEPYRTLLGHFRHEVGHYYFTVLVRSGADRAAFESLIGDPDANYQAALDRHYRQGPPADWHDTFVSAYANMHPAEDWAETFAHYLHIRDTLDTAAAFAMAPAGAALNSPLQGDVGFQRIIDLWLPLEWALNMVSRSMGHPDLYPFVLPPMALEKMRFVHRLITETPPA